MKIEITGDPVIVSILTRPAGRVLLDKEKGLPFWRDVSILTRPAGRVLRGGDGLYRSAHGVSILTRPAGLRHRSGFCDFSLFLVQYM